VDDADESLVNELGLSLRELEVNGNYFGEWSMTATFSAHSGSPFTPRVVGATSSVATGTPQVVTQGYTDQDFTSAGGTCIARSYSSGQTCTVNVAFIPKYPGPRAGAVVFKDSGGTVIKS